MVVSELNKIHNFWLATRTEIKTVYQQAQPFFNEHEPLIKYFEEAMMSPEAVMSKPVKWLTADFCKLRNLN